MQEAHNTEGGPAFPDAADIERVLGYLKTDEAEIRSAKVNVVWADTMARAADLLRAVLIARSAK